MLEEVIVQTKEGKNKIPTEDQSNLYDLLGVFLSWSEVPIDEKKLKFQKIILMFSDYVNSCISKDDLFANFTFKCVNDFCKSLTAEYLNQEICDFIFSTSRLCPSLLI